MLHNVSAYFLNAPRNTHANYAELSHPFTSMCSLNHEIHVNTCYHQCSYMILLSEFYHCRSPTLPATSTLLKFKDKNNENFPYCFEIKIQSFFQSKKISDDQELIQSDLISCILHLKKVYIHHLRHCAVHLNKHCNPTIHMKRENIVNTLLIWVIPNYPTRF